MASVVHSEEMELSILAHLTGCLAAHVPVNVVSVSELLLAIPFSGKSPGFSSSPVADPVLVSRVDEYLHIVVVKNRCDLRHEVGHPVAKKSSVDKLVALNPFTTGCSQGSLGVSIVQESVRLGEIVAKWRACTWFTDVVHVELRVEGVSDD